MIATDRTALERRVLLLAPTLKDASLTNAILGRAGMTCVSCSSLDEVCRELSTGAGVVILPEEQVVPEHDGCLSQWLAGQPPWSDLPLLVLSRLGADSPAVSQAMDLLGNVTVLERPTRVAALVSAVRTALRARQRQYQIREHLSEHRRTAAALREADRRKDEFLAILAHELRNPLAPIRNSLHVLRLTSLVDSPAERVAEMIDRQVNHMVRLVDDLLEVARVSRGKIELRKEPIEVEALVRSAIETSKPLIEAGKHQLSLSLPAAPLVLDGDAVRLTQVFANLLNNAARYSDPGGWIGLEVREDAGWAEITVRDAGRGIPSHELPRIFELFMQGDRPTGGSPGGLGIGLTLVKSLVKMHGGSVDAYSEGPGRGSAFVVRLPLVAGEQARPIAGTPVPHSTPLASQRVLVVDDNHDAAESLETLLRLLGADVHVAYSGADALEAIERYDPAVVLLDLGMPGMDGLEVARRIRQRSRHVTLIALTGWGQEDDRRRSRDAGFDHHLVKPADIDALQRLLVSLDPGDER